MAKGSGFEREMCRKLSLWWSEGKDDDLFWRTSTSGARATVRGRKGQTTRGHYGDICATDDLGKPLIDLICFELKRGYNRDTVFDLLDCKKSAKAQTWDKWIVQAKEAQELAKAEHWLVIHRRDRREAMVVFPADLGDDLDLKCGEIDVPILNATVFTKKHGYFDIVSMKLDDFLREVHPQQIREAKS